MQASLFSEPVIVQGITGTHGRFHTKAMLDAGTNIVGGTSPNSSISEISGVPVSRSISDILAVHPVKISVVFVPAAFAKDALMEAISAKIPLIICITEGIPVHDMLVVKHAAAKAGVTIIGPNSPGVLIPGLAKIGIIPASIGLASHDKSGGSVAVVSRSGTLTYEVAASLTERGIGQAYIIGIGGDRVSGTSFIDCLELFEHDPRVSSMILIGEVGGQGEIKAAEYIEQSVTKPVYAYIAGHSAPPGVQLGHAGAILGSNAESAAAKTARLHQAGCRVADSLTNLVDNITLGD